MRQGREQELLVHLRRKVIGVHAAHGCADRAFPRLADASLDGVLDRIVELVPAAGEELDAVVGHGVVRGREHHAEIGLEGIGEVGDCRGRNHAEQGDVDAGACQACDHCRFEEFTAGTSVACNDCLGSMPVECAHVREDVGSSDGQIECKLCGELAIREPPHSIGTEKSAQRISACCTAKPCGPS